MPDVEPEGTVTVAGTVALELFDVRATAIPPVGAGPLMVTVPVELEPPVTVVGERVMPVTVGALIVRVAVLDPDASVPVMVSVTVFDTP